MKNSRLIYIAGNKTEEDWRVLRSKLVNDNSPVLWEEAYTDYYLQRLNLRYLDPIKTLIDNSTYQGEGFTVVAIQCTLVEFLESTVEGLRYRYLRRGEVLSQFEYSSSKSIFVKFLTTRTPFASTFSSDAATDFYANVRCGLLHEACTKQGWRIWGNNSINKIIDVDNKIVYRDNFQEALLIFIQNYKTELLVSSQLKEAFIRKFDSLCE